ncbi:MAG: STAS domain-containing protein [Gammaproteobacteria bacterium]|nr:MAG: STAS domain-containing protein [Gammaproteobacteria bacterium]
MTSEQKGINQLLIEQIQTNIGRIAKVIEERGGSVFSRANLLSQEELNDYTMEFLELFILLLQAGDHIDRDSAEFEAIKQFFVQFSYQLLVRGGSMNEFVRFIQFLQFVFLENLESDEELDFEQTRRILLRLAALFNEIMIEVFNVYLEEKERTIQAQAEKLREVSTPITEIWDGVLVLPIIGSMDSERTMRVMENLLERIDRDRSRVVVMDVTGMLSIDSQVSHYLIQMVRAIRLMGAEAILTGIRPDIAKALTSLNIDLEGVNTRPRLVEGLKEAFNLLGVRVSLAE